MVWEATYRRQLSMNLRTPRTSSRCDEVRGVRRFMGRTTPSPDVGIRHCGSAGSAAESADQSVMRSSSIPARTLATLTSGLLALLLLQSTGCSIRRLAVGKVADALSKGGTTFTSDDDPELVKDALPFSLKLMESLLAEAPEHTGLLLALTSGFTQYGYAFVQQEADEIEGKDFQAAEALRSRARRLYLRARGYGLRGLEVAHPGFTKALAANPVEAVKAAAAQDAGQLYWTAAAWAAAISVGKDDSGLIAEIPQMEALLDRALALDESWGDGAIHGLLITYEMSRVNGKGEPAERSRHHFERALALGGGHLAGPYVSFAESVCVEEQDATQFREMLEKALAVNPDEHPEARLVNLLMQRRARWLLSREEDLFLLPAKTGQN
jgi:predicted anti-sigma-YlaC factor YlaD